MMCGETPLAIDTNSAELVDISAILEFEDTLERRICNATRAYDGGSSGESPEALVGQHAQAVNRPLLHRSHEQAKAHGDWAAVGWGRVCAPELEAAAISGATEY